MSRHSQRKRQYIDLGRAVKLLRESQQTTADIVAARLGVELEEYLGYEKGIFVQLRMTRLGEIATSYGVSPQMAANYWAAVAKRLIAQQLGPDIARTLFAGAHYNYEMLIAADSPDRSATMLDQPNCA